MCRLTDHDVLLAGTMPDDRAVSDWVRRNMPDLTDVWALVERVPKGWLEEGEREDAIRFFRPGDGFDVAGFEAGYAFGVGFEIRWEPGPVGLSVRYVGTPVREPGTLNDWLGEPPRPLEVRNVEYRVWGRRVRDGLNETAAGNASRGTPFISARIPRVLYYPAAAGSVEYVSLLVKEYRDARTDGTWLWRFAGVKEHP
jgi:hypothetical protein